MQVDSDAHHLVCLSLPYILQWATVYLPQGVSCWCLGLGWLTPWFATVHTNIFCNFLPVFKHSRCSRLGNHLFAWSKFLVFAVGNWWSTHQGHTCHQHEMCKNLWHFDETVPLPCHMPLTHQPTFLKFGQQHAPLFGA